MAMNFYMDSDAERETIIKVCRSWRAGGNCCQPHGAFRA
jgi:hypothetical protein